MPKKGYKQTLEHKTQLSRTWFKKGHKSLITEETKKKMSISRQGIIFSETHRENLSKSMKGTTWEERYGIEKTIKMKQQMKEKPLMYGKHHSLESKKKISMALKGHPSYKDKTRYLGVSNYMKGRFGELWNNWQGGKSFEPYGLDFNDRFKEGVRERDNRCCIICNKMEEELNELLHVHHVDYIKINNFPQNCVSLCRKCHAQTNSNRHHWTLFFQSLLKERYNYEYTPDQRIILDFLDWRQKW